MSNCRLLPILALAVLACASAHLSEGRDRSAIDLCLHEFKYRTSIGIEHETNNAYVVTLGNQSEIVFTRGEVGLFGRADRTAAPRLTCSVIGDGPEARLYYLGRPMEAPLIDDRSVVRIGESNQAQNARVALWSKSPDMRSAEKFEFQEEKLFDRNADIDYPPDSETEAGWMN